MIKTERKTLFIVFLLVAVVISVLTAVVCYTTTQQDTSSSSQVVDQVFTPKPYIIEIISEPNSRFAELGIIRIIGLEYKQAEKDRYSLGYGDALTAGLKEVDSKYNIVDITPIDYRLEVGGYGGSTTIELIILVNKAK